MTKFSPPFSGRGFRVNSGISKSRIFRSKSKMTEYLGGLTGSVHSTTRETISLPNLAFQSGTKKKVQRRSDPAKQKQTHN